MDHGRGAELQTGVADGWKRFKTEYKKAEEYSGLISSSSASAGASPGPGSHTRLGCLAHLLLPLRFEPPTVPPPSPLPPSLPSPFAQDHHHQHPLYLIVIAWACACKIQRPLFDGRCPFVVVVVALIVVASAVSRFSSFRNLIMYYYILVGQHMPFQLCVYMDETKMMMIIKIC